MAVAVAVASRVDGPGDDEIATLRGKEAPVGCTHHLCQLGRCGPKHVFFPVPMVKYLGSQIVWGFWAQSHMLRFVFLPVFQGWKGDFQTSEALVLTMS